MINLDLNDQWLSTVGKKSKNKSFYKKRQTHLINKKSNLFLSSPKTQLLEGKQTLLKEFFQTSITTNNGLCRNLKEKDDFKQIQNSYNFLDKSEINLLNLQEHIELTSTNKVTNVLNYSNKTSTNLVEHAERFIEKTSEIPVNSVNNYSEQTSQISIKNVKKYSELKYNEKTLKNIVEPDQSFIEITSEIPVDNVNIYNEQTFEIPIEGIKKYSKLKYDEKTSKSIVETAESFIEITSEIPVDNFNNYSEQTSHIPIEHVKYNNELKYEDIKSHSDMTSTVPVKCGVSEPLKYIKNQRDNSSSATFADDTKCEKSKPLKYIKNHNDSDATVSNNTKFNQKFDHSQFNMEECLAFFEAPSQDLDSAGYKLDLTNTAELTTEHLADNDFLSSSQANCIYSLSTLDSEDNSLDSEKSTSKDLRHESQCSADKGLVNSGKVDCTVKHLVLNSGVYNHNLLDNDTGLKNQCLADNRLINCSEEYYVDNHASNFSKVDYTNTFLKDNLSDNSLYKIDSKGFNKRLISNDTRLIHIKNSDDCELADILRISNHSNLIDMQYISNNSKLIDVPNLDRRTNLTDIYQIDNHDISIKELNDYVNCNSKIVEVHNAMDHSISLNKNLNNFVDLESLDVNPTLLVDNFQNQLTRIYDDIMASDED